MESANERRIRFRFLRNIRILQRTSVGYKTYAMASRNRKAEMSDTECDRMNAIFDDIECLAVTAQSELSRQSLLADLATWIKNRAERMAA